MIVNFDIDSNFKSKCVLSQMRKRNKEVAKII